MPPANEKTLRNLSTMHVIFACSAATLCVAVFWMLAADHNESWRDYQSEFFRLEAARQQTEIDLIDTPSFQEDVAELNEQVRAAQKELEKREGEIAELAATARAAETKYGNQLSKVKEERAKRDVASANYGLGVTTGKSAEKLAELQAAYDKLQAVVETEELKLQRELADRDAKAEALADAVAGLTAAEAAKTELTAELDRINTGREKIAPTGFDAFKRSLMELPIIDGFNGHLRIQQVWLPDLMVPLGMTETARFDRCQTCHLGIDRAEADGSPTFPHGLAEDGKYPHPFSGHPRLDLYLTASSPHPLQEFGCTACHDGQGSGTEFSNSSHTPDNPVQKAEWVEKYGYASNHFWELPMATETFRESGCIKCHHDVIELGENREFGPTAPKVYEGWQLIRQYGCFGCHEINGYAGTQRIGPDLRLEPNTEEQAAKIAADPNQVAGNMRKVGPSLEHVAQKTTSGWLEFWTNNPMDFRPTTRMPRFFGLEVANDAHAQKFNPVEIAAISAYLMDKSTDIPLDSPRQGYEPDAERGKNSFAERGCMACHSHAAFPDATAKIGADFGPDLSKVAKKIRAGKDGFNWLYTWIRNPELYHARTKMPDLFLDPQTVNNIYSDPAADIAAFLLEGERGDYAALDVASEENQAVLDELVTLYLKKVLPLDQITGNEERDVDGYFETRQFPLPKESIKGDEIELVAEGTPDDAEWTRLKLNYLGRRTISQYGCYGCHNIAGFESAQPIGTALQDWGRKDPTKIATEHIAEFLHHHGEPDGSSTMDRAKAAVDAVAAGQSFEDNPELEFSLKAAARIESLEHHGRDGFIWQKLRQPRTYDYEKLTTKRYDERLRMPKFPFDERQIEAISTFVLGLVAEPPAPRYVYTPDATASAVLEGERLLQKYNCTGCHMTELPKITLAALEDDLLFHTGLADDEFQAGYDLLMKLKPPRQGKTGEERTVVIEEEEMTLPVLNFHGLIFAEPDPEEDFEYQEWSFDLWETLKVGDEVMLPGSKMTFLAPQMISQEPGKGGEYTEWLVSRLMQRDGKSKNDRGKSRQMAAPPLYLEGQKVQTPWLYRFLLNPGRIRYETVLRMPKFNMDDHEARALANYFAAVEKLSFPYQDVPEREPEYLNVRNALFEERFGKSHDYLTESWKALNGPLCIKCHSVGGNEFQASADPSKDIRGPNLGGVRDRLRPDWLSLWLYKPMWITPYTSMPVNFNRSKPAFQDSAEGKKDGLFNGDSDMQVIGVRDALLNYYRLIERDGSTLYKDPNAPAVPAAGAATGEE